VGRCVGKCGQALACAPTCGRGGEVWASAAGVAEATRMRMCWHVLTFVTGVGMGWHVLACMAGLGRDATGGRDMQM
jgi:hypothetical protein